MDWIGDAWQDITTPQPVPSSTAVLLTAAGVLLVLLVPVAWHVARHGLTIVHEAAHATSRCSSDAGCRASGCTRTPPA